VTKRPKLHPTKERGTGESVIKLLRHLVRQVGGLVFLWK
jgi:hypothetical protein